MGSRKNIMNIRFIKSVEILPSKKSGIDELLKARENLTDSVDAMTSPNNPRGYPGIDPIMALWLVTRDSNVIAIPHLTPRDNNRLALYSKVITAAKFNINHFFIIGGDTIDSRINSKPVMEMDVLSTIEEIANQSIGKNFLKEYNENIVVGAIMNPHRIQEKEIVNSKYEKGARFFITHSIFDSEVLKQDWIAKRNFKLLAGFIPILKKSQLDITESLDMRIPKNMRDRILNSSDLESFFINYISESVDDLKGYIDGIHLMPLGKNQFAKKLMEVL